MATRTSRSIQNRSIQALVSAPDSEASTPRSSAYPSAYPSEDEDEDVEEDETKPKPKPFSFLDLAPELRNKIYGYVFHAAPDVVDLDPTNFRSVRRHINIFWVSRQLRDEVSHYFYSTRAFRIFPTHPGRFFKTKKPLLARMSPRNRASMSTLQLRLGPGFNNPPRGWVVNDALGLQDCINVRILKVFVEIDPSNDIFKGWRAADDFYQRFSKNLLDQILKIVKSVDEVEFDGFPSVPRDGPMIKALRGMAEKHGKKISWGPERGWKEEERNERWMQSLRDALPDVDTRPSQVRRASQTVACPA